MGYHTDSDDDQLLAPVLLPDFLNRLLYVPSEHPAYKGKSRSAESGQDSVLRLRLWVFLYLVSAPWIWVTTGLYIWQDHRAAIALYALLCCLLPALLLGRDHEALRFLPLNARPWGLVAAVAVGWLVLLGGWFFPYFHLVDFEHLPLQMQKIQLSAGHFWPFTFYFVIVNPLVEELFWRGLVLRELMFVTSDKIALLISSFFFGFWHWILIQHFFAPVWVPWITLAIMLGGVIFGSLYQKTGTLMAPVIVHSLGADLPIVIIVWNCLGRMGQL